MNKRIKKKHKDIYLRAEDKYLHATANDILSHWFSDLLKNNSTDSFYKIPVDVIEEEIKEIKGTIDNCTLMQDKLGILCNEKYLKFLLKIHRINKEIQNG